MNVATAFTLVSIVALGSVGPAHGAPSPVFSTMNVTVSSDAHVVDGTDIDLDFDNAFQNGTLDPMKVLAKAVSSDGPGKVRTMFRGGAKWLSASRGRTEFQLGWTTRNVTENGRATTRNYGNGNPNWEYVFVADVDSTFTLTWHIVGGGSNSEGLNGFRLDLNSSPYQTMDVNTDGSLSIALLAGASYAIGLFSLAETNPEGQFEGMPLGTRTAHMNGNFDWVIAPR